MTSDGQITNMSEEVVASLRGIEILAAPHLKPPILRLIRDGVYEKLELEYGLANLRPGDRIMEMGTGAGIVGSVFAKHISPLMIRSYEANPDLIEHIRKLYAHNGVDSVVSVSNNVVVSGENTAPHVKFNIRANFLGSRLSEENLENTARKVLVPTKHYDDIKREYSHNVIVMDIEGGELEFLASADLSGVELVMLELHPKVYGAEGRRKVISYLLEKGFVMDPETSKGQVASFKKPARMKLKPDYSYVESVKVFPQKYNIDPHKALSNNIITIPNAVLAKTPRSEGFRIAASVFDENRNPVPEAVCWLSHRQTATIERSAPRRNRIKDLPGAWLFGGRFSPHFGHFLSETLSRLWALDYIDVPVKGVLFFPAHNDFVDPASNMFSQLASIMDAPVNYKICDEFYRVDQLIVPPQGSGIGRLMVSSPEMRQYVKRHFKTDLAPTPHEKIYISRSGSFGKTGRNYLGEARLEELLEAEGYLIFHPEQHSWQDQIRHYLSARYILGPDGSAFHLVNFVGRKDLNLGIIQRRPGHDASQMAQQGRLYGIENASTLSHLGRLWSTSGSWRAGLEMVSELKLESLCAELKEKGFISQKSDWSNLNDVEIEGYLLNLSQESGADFRPVSSAHDSLSHFPRCAAPGRPRAFMTTTAGS